VKNNNSIKHTVIVSICLCLVCSIVVSSAAVILKQKQQANKLIDRNKNILAAAGLFDPSTHDDQDISRLFKQFEPRFIDVRAGEFILDDKAKALNLDANTYSQISASNDVATSYELPPEQDIASIKRQAKYILVYLLKENGAIKRIVLPVHGYGLWGTLYGYIALEKDGNTVAGLTFYSHKETPGLGAKVDLPQWKALWPGKKIYSESSDVEIKLAKGKANTTDLYRVDGLSGATLTSNGVNNILNFWMGDLGYKKLLTSIFGNDQ
jgi:Na+-transporting NADH:ubiquinone oxidoreductase subunit C